MPKCDACKKEAISLFDCNSGNLCDRCADSWLSFQGSVFDWCIASHAELQAKQLAAEQEERFNREHQDMVEKVKSAAFARFDLGGTSVEQRPTDAELIALAGLAQAEVAALASVSAVPTDLHRPVIMDDFDALPSFAALYAALKSRGVIK